MTRLLLAILVGLWAELRATWRTLLSDWRSMGGAT